MDLPAGFVPDGFVPDAAPDSTAPAPAPAPAPPQPSFLSRVASTVAQPFVDIGHGLMDANRTVAHAIFHPVDTVNAIRANPGAYAREALRGVNDNIPLANSAVEAIGGPAAVSPEDAAAAPGVRSVGAVAGAPIGGELLGGIASKVARGVAEGAANVLDRAAEGAEGRQIARTKDALELKANKGTRVGLKSDVVDAAIADSPELRKAAGNDAKVAQVTTAIKQKAAGELAPIYQASGPADEAVAKAVSNVDERIAALRGGDVNAAAAARKLQTLRDEFNTRLGERGEVTARDLRTEQSAYQKNGYAKNINADPDVAANILAQREMSKAIGDALVEHVTGMDYTAAKAAAAADPDSLAARLFKANDQINAANKIEAGIADRANKPQPAHGPAAVLKRVAAHGVAPALVGSTHGVGAGIATAVGQEALHALPGVARAGAAAVDSALARGAPRLAAALRPSPMQAVQTAAAAGNQRALRLLNIARGAGAPGTPPVGAAAGGTLATQ